MEPLFLQVPIFSTFPKQTPVSRENSYQKGSVTYTLTDLGVFCVCFYCSLRFLLIQYNWCNHWGILICTSICLYVCMYDLTRWELYPEVYFFQFHNSYFHILTKRHCNKNVCFHEASKTRFLQVKANKF